MIGRLLTRADVAPVPNQLSSQGNFIDGEFGPMPTDAIVAQAHDFAPDAVLFGHSGSTSGHPVIAEVAQAIARAMPRVLIVYGGVFPTYHWREILAEEPCVTAIVRGEGEVVHAGVQVRAPSGELGQGL